MLMIVIVIVIIIKFINVIIYIVVVDVVVVSSSTSSIISSSNCNSSSCSRSSRRNKKKMYENDFRRQYSEIHWFKLLLLVAALSWLVQVILTVKSYKNGKILQIRCSVSWCSCADVIGIHILPPGPVQLWGMTRKSLLWKGVVDCHESILERTAGAEKQL